MKAFMPPKKMIDMFTLKVEANQEIEKISQQVPAKCEEYGFTLLTTYNYHEIVENKGFPIKQKVWIYEICVAKTAALMLTSNPNFSIFMPCKLSVYEENGKTIISTMNMGIMLEAVKTDKELYDNATSLFTSIKNMMNSFENITK
ncbi:MAG: DUF302 domain-containing protein [Melioribacteraceae bacterium]|nr:DUF302 domain-containing protein [Melioribacteraceae bacterium]